MARYIDADKLIDFVSGRSTHLLNDWDTLGVLCAIDEQPTADVVERKDLDTIAEAHEQIGYEKGYRDGYAQSVEDDLISRQAAIDCVCYDQEYTIECLEKLPSVQPESTRTFVELVVEYPAPELCTYKEYKGKPYYSIKYIENGETYVGYGTYKPEVLSQFLKEYFISSVQSEPLTDKEQRIFLAAMGREEKVCEEVDRNHVREPYEDSLVRVCKEIRRKVKGALWT